VAASPMPGARPGAGPRRTCMARGRRSRMSRAGVS
jgi:hypothetical protein